VVPRGWLRWAEWLTAVNCIPGRTIRHVNGRIQLKYGHSRPGNGCRIRCTVLWLDYGIIRCRIRWSFSVLRKRAVLHCRIHAVSIQYDKSVIYDSRTRAVTAPYFKNLFPLIFRYSKVAYNRKLLIKLDPIVSNSLCFNIFKNFLS